MIEDLREKLKDKSILVISSKFFTENKGIKLLKEICPKAVSIDLRPQNTVLMKVGLRYFPFIFKYYLNSYYKKIIREEFDQVLVVNPDCLYPTNINSIRRLANPSRMILYMCDSFENRKRAKRLINFFDKCLTYDSRDAKNYNISLRPLYFLSGIDNKNDIENTHEPIDVLFVGTAHSDRVKIISTIKNQCEKYKLNYYFYLYLQSPLIFYFYKIFNKNYRGIKKSFLNFTPIKYDDYLEKLENTKVVIDMQHPKNSGLTLRTFEVLGKKKKIITTNYTIQEYDFYNEKNISIVDRNNPIIDCNFCNTDYENIPEPLYYKYSYYGWLEDVLS